MNFLQTFVLLGTLCGCCLGEATNVDCRNSSSVLMAQENCFSQFGVAIDVDIGHIQNAIQEDPSFVCKNQASYQSGMSCVMAISRTCLESVGQEAANILPDEDRIIAGISFICDNINDLNTKCITDNNQAIQQCALTRTQSLLANTSRPDNVYITCKSFEVSQGCYSDLLGPCSRHTADVLVEYMQRFISPPVCSSGDRPGIGALTISLLSIATLLVWNPSL